MRTIKDRAIARWGDTDAVGMRILAAKKLNVEQPVNSEKEGGDKAMERVEGGYLIHEKNLNGEEVTHFRPGVTEEEKAIMKDKKAKD